MTKLILLLLIMGGFINGFAQQARIESRRVIVPRDSLFRLFALRNSLSARAKLANVLANGDKAYVLPLDGTICIVPDMSMYNYKMPVVKGKVTGFMPNASPRAQIIPDNRSLVK